MGDALLLVGALAGLYFGAEWLVRGASRIAASLRVSTLVIGLTVVAFGTSMPEMLACVVAAWNGSTDIVLGNVFGSNIANVGLILGITALVRAVPVRLALLRREVPFMLMATVGVYAMAATGTITRGAGAALFAGLGVFTWLAMRWARQERDREVATQIERLEEELGLHRETNIWVEAGWLLAGLVLLSVGAKLLVDSAVRIAQAVGVSEFLISVTMVAIGTSLPELATSVVCVLRDESDVLLGNVVGSNIFNLLGALGLGALVSPIPVAASIVSIDLPVVLAFSLAMAAMLITHRAVVRWEGAALLAGYAGYLLFLLA